MLNKKANHRRPRRSLRLEAMEGRRLLAGDVFMHNAEMPSDVNGDHHVTAVDALSVINQLNPSGGSSSLSAAGESPAASSSSTSSLFVDVNGDKQLTALDALRVINTISRGEQSTPVTTLAPTTTTTAGSPTDTEVDDASETNETPDANETTEPTTALLGTTLMGPFTAIAIIKFETGTINGIANNELEVAVSGASPNANLNVKVGGVPVGQIATDTNGVGMLVLATRPSHANESALPADFPAISVGTTIQIGTDLSGTFASVTSTDSDFDQHDTADEQNDDQGEQDDPTVVETDDDNNSVIPAHR